MREYVGHITLDELLQMCGFDSITVNWLPAFGGVKDVHLSIQYGKITRECTLALKVDEISLFSQFIAEVINE